MPTSPDLIALLPQLTGAQLIGHLPSFVQRVHTDTRSLLKDDLFVALVGDKFDAHYFIANAKQHGATAAIAQRGLMEAGLSGVHVPDSRIALGELAGLWRAKFVLPLIAVTGSNGKTTVTQMIASILRAAVGAEAVLATQGNLNNDIGVPLTVLRLCAAHQLAVVELGMNHPGEIAELASIAQPTITLINNAQREHQEFMGTVEAVAKENAAAITALPCHGSVVMPSDDVHTALWRRMAGKRQVLSFSDEDSNADVGLCVDAPLALGTASHIRTPKGRIVVQLQTLGKHNIRNALAAVACALAAEVSLDAIAQGLATFVPVQGRSKLLRLNTDTQAHLMVVDDTYNANPDSVRAAIDLLAGLPAPRCLVLGDMGEVGTQSLTFHTEVLDYARVQQFDAIVCTGEEMAKAVAHLAQTLEPLSSTHHEQTITPLWIPNMDDLTACVRQCTQQGGSLLVKGSRFMRMERVVQALSSTWVQ